MFSTRAFSSAAPLASICVINRAINPMTESFAELFEQSQAANLAKLKPGSIVSGVVVDVRTDVVVIKASNPRALSRSNSSVTTPAKSTSPSATP
jgi:hypothetical protein